VRHIYVSPHADDVALSCGGQIVSRAERGNDTLVLTMFTSDIPEGKRLSPEEERAFADAINAERKSEDDAAWASIGVEVQHAGLPEALLRKKFPIAILGDGEDGITARVFDTLCDYARLHPGAAFYFPAGIGSHIDHLACARAAMRLLDDNVLERIFLYEDTPYGWLKFLRNRRYAALGRCVALGEETRATLFRQAGLTLRQYRNESDIPFPRGRKLFTLLFWSLSIRNAIGRLAARSEVYRGTVRLLKLSDDAVAGKTALLSHYRSQIPMLFGSDPEAVYRRCRDELSTEVLIEITRKPAVA